MDDGSIWMGLTDQGKWMGPVWMDRGGRTNGPRGADWWLCGLHGIL